MTKRILKNIAMIILMLLLIATYTFSSIIKAKAVEKEEKMFDIKNFSAKSAILMDADTGNICLEKNASERLPIASMVKIMTALLTLEELEKGTLKLTDSIPISENAASMGGSQAFLDANQNYVVEELLKSIIVASANDSCVALAEHISGSVESFVDKMNDKAKQLSMNDTNFVNCTGLPAPNLYSSAKDVAIMTKEVMKYPLFSKFCKVWMFDFKHPSGRVTSLSNTNKLIRAYQGILAGKTGFTNEAKFCLSSVAERNGMSFISVIIGAENSKKRFFENSTLLNYGFSNYVCKNIIKKGEVVYEGKVPMSKEKQIKIVASKDFKYSYKKGTKPKIETTKEIMQLCAPIKKGSKVGKINIIVDGKNIGEVEICADNELTKLGYLDIIDDLVIDWIK